MTAQSPTHIWFGVYCIHFINLSKQNFIKIRKFVYENCCDFFILENSKNKKTKKKKKAGSDDSAVEESDDGDEEGRELDYISDSSDRQA